MPLPTPTQTPTATGSVARRCSGRADRHGPPGRRRRDRLARRSERGPASAGCRSASWAGASPGSAGPAPVHVQSGAGRGRTRAMSTTSNLVAVRSDRPAGPGDRSRSARSTWASAVTISSTSAEAVRSRYDGQVRLGVQRGSRGRHVAHDDRVGRPRGEAQGVRPVGPEPGRMPAIRANARPRARCPRRTLGERADGQGRTGRTPEDRLRRSRVVGVRMPDHELEHTADVRRARRRPAPTTCRTTICARRSSWSPTWCSRPRPATAR